MTINMKIKNIFIAVNLIYSTQIQSNEIYIITTIPALLFGAIVAIAKYETAFEEGRRSNVDIISYPLITAGTTLLITYALKSIFKNPTYEEISEFLFHIKTNTKFRISHLKKDSDAYENLINNIKNAYSDVEKPVYVAYYELKNNIVKTKNFINFIKSQNENNFHTKALHILEKFLYKTQISLSLIEKNGALNEI